MFFLNKQGTFDFSQLPHFEERQMHGNYLNTDFSYFGQREEERKKGYWRKHD
jgi:hypothetical protein